MQPNQAAYERDVIALLLTWEKVCARRKDAPAIDADMVQLYAEALMSLGATSEELKAVRLAMTMRSAFFPTIAEIKDAIEEMRAEKDAARKREYWAAMVPCIDEHGQDSTAPYWAVRDGRLLPEGERNMDALHPRDAALQAAQLALPAREVTPEERVRTILHLAEEKGMEVAVYFLSVIGEKPEDTAIEREALKANRARIDAMHEERTPSAKKGAGSYMETSEVDPAEAQRLIDEARESAERKRRERES